MANLLLVGEMLDNGVLEHRNVAKVVVMVLKESIAFNKNHSTKLFR